MNKLSKQNKIIVGVLSLFLILIVGYAIFSESINIGGTASASGDFNIIFNSVGTIKEEGSSGATATISSNKKSLTVTVPKLEYPSAYVEVPVVIKNAGSVTAKIVGIETVGLDNPDIKVTYSGIAQNDRMAPNEEKNMKIKVTWDSASNTVVDSLTFSVSINYEQVSGSDVTVPPAEEMTRDMFTWDSDTIVSGLSDKGIDYLKSNGGHLVIPEGVTEIVSVSYDFINDTGGLFDKGFSPVKIGNIDISSGVTFEQLTQHSIITRVSFPPTLTKIGAGAFAYNLNLTGELSLPTGLKEIGDGAFFSSGISGNLIIPNSVVGIWHRAFERTNITTISFGSVLEGIGQSAFAYCNNLAGELYIPDRVKNIGRMAFYFDGLDSKITSISIPSTVSYVSSGEYATFYGRVSPTIRN